MLRYDAKDCAATKLLFYVSDDDIDDMRWDERDGSGGSRVLKWLLQVILHQYLMDYLPRQAAYMTQVHEV